MRVVQRRVREQVTSAIVVVRVVVFDHGVRDVLVEVEAAAVTTRCTIAVRFVVTDINPRRVVSPDADRPSGRIAPNPVRLGD
jgi:hypothetical protein